VFRLISCGHGRWHNQDVPGNNALCVLDRDQLRDVTLEDEDLMREVVSALIDDTQRQLERLDRAIRQADSNETVRLAHYSKGACANVGAASTAAILLTIERKAAEGDFGTCGHSLEALTSELEKLRLEAARL
jgi:HPt (histidine-containing phosphotransfer) domain-containing protein